MTDHEKDWDRFCDKVADGIVERLFSNNRMKRMIRTIVSLTIIAAAEHERAGDARAFLELCADQNVHIRLDRKSGKLMIRGYLPDEMREALKTCRLEVAAYLRRYGDLMGAIFENGEAK